MWSQTKAWLAHRRVQIGWGLIGISIILIGFPVQGPAVHIFYFTYHRISGRGWLTITAGILFLVGLGLVTILRFRRQRQARRRLADLVRLQGQRPPRPPRDWVALALAALPGLAAVFALLFHRLASPRNQWPAAGNQASTADHRTGADHRPLQRRHYQPWLQLHRYPARWHLRTPAPHARFSARPANRRRRYCVPSSAIQRVRQPEGRRRHRPPRCRRTFRRPSLWSAPATRTRWPHDPHRSQSRAPSADAQLDPLRLTGADLTGADLTGANLNYTDLAGANLTGADLTRRELA